MSRMDQPAVHHHSIRIGGLMRCCIEAIRSRAVHGTEGELDECPSCHDKYRFRDGAWEWYREWGLRK